MGSLSDRTDNTIAIGVATGAFTAMVVMPKFEVSTLEALDRKATDLAIEQGRAPDSREFNEKTATTWIPLQE